MFVRMASNQSLLYDTTTNTWNITVLNGAYRVSSRLDGNAVLGNVLPLLFVHDHEGRIFSDTLQARTRKPFISLQETMEERRGAVVSETESISWIPVLGNGSGPLSKVHRRACDLLQVLAS